MERKERFSEPYDYDQLRADLDVLTDRHPSIRVETIGYSVLGSEIPSVTIGHGPLNIHYNAAIHANEWITAALLMAFLEDYAESAREASVICQKTGAELQAIATLHAVPMVNPDGVELAIHGLRPDHPNYDRLLRWNNGKTDFSDWKANARGVDLNDQFPANWQQELERRSPKRPGPRDYAGSSPLSEPEAQMMAEYTRKRQFDMVIALHTQGREIYWNYRKLEPASSEPIGRVLADISGYKAVKLADSDAGYKDWFIQEFRKPGFTVEVGFGTNPLPFEQGPSLYQELLPILEKGLYVLNESEE